TFFVDTNILSYLIDETYPLLNEFVKYLKESPVINLVSSEYALLEFIGVRKKEHYFRAFLKQMQETGKVVNLSSFLQYHNEFSLPECDFYTLLPAIKSNVDSEKDRISSEFGIKFCNGFHRNLFNLTSDICLSSKISREDSLILVSALLPNEGVVNQKVIILTNDKNFHDWFYDTNIQTNVDGVFQNHDVPKPNLQHLKKINIDGQVLNLTSDVELEKLKLAFNSFLKNILINNLSNLFIGKNFVPQGTNFPLDCICFKAEVNKSIQNRKYLTIIGKDLDFVYNTENSISFWNNGREISDERFIATDGNSYLSFKIEIDNANSEKANILARLKEEGNLIFLHPDN
ncbi:hypothetical protein EZS27_036358, partial [termite gut metagenome]